MSGSIFDFNYKTDAGQDCFVRMDKSNALIVSNTANNSATVPGVPANVTPRFATYRSLDNKVTRKIIVGSNTTNVVANLPASFSDAYIAATGSNPVFLASFSPERRRLPQITDTGLTT